MALLGIGKCIIASIKSFYFKESVKSVKNFNIHFFSTGGTHLVIDEGTLLCPGKSLAS